MDFADNRKRGRVRNYETVSESAWKDPGSFRAKRQTGGMLGRSGQTEFEGLPLTSTMIMQDPTSGVLDYRDLEMKPGMEDRPLTICPNGYIFLETQTPYSAEAADFLIAIAEPISRPELVHEFQLTVFSLYAALSMGISVAEIITALESFCKNEIPPSLHHALKVQGSCFGKVKLVLRDSRYFIESPLKEELELMVSNKTVGDSRIRNSLGVRQVQGRQPNEQLDTTDDNSTSQLTGIAGDLLVSEAPELDKNLLAFMTGSNLNGGTGASELEHLIMTQPETSAAAVAARKETATETKDNTIKQQVYSFEVVSDHISAIKEAALKELNRPLLSEYDFRRDVRNPDLEITLRPSTKVRYYQERALRKMFSNGRARSGIIVLPCGAGKTLTGIVASTTIKKSTMVLTSSAVAVDQWRRSFIDFSTVDPSKVICLTSDSKSELPEGAVVVCSTYTMMSFSGHRSSTAEIIMKQIQAKEWGLLIFDEVQFAPAPAFRKVNDICKSHCKLGLTATLVREDDLINDLQWLIGPKLDEANWLEVQQAGYLAKAKCSEVWCPMTYEFYRAYIGNTPIKQRRLWVCNPNKLRVCEYLIRFHEARRDKVIVFSDNLFALKEVALALKKPFISGEVGLQERMIIINKFKSVANFNTIFLSKVGDNAIDIPCANVVIQISFNFASRRQEAQRLGRILRPKPNANSEDEFDAYFYSLVSKDTQEMAYADKRQQFIIDQGYAYKVLAMSVFPMEHENLLYSDPSKQIELLQRILTAADYGGDLEKDDVVLSGSQTERTAAALESPVKKASTVLSALVGGEGEMRTGRGTRRGRGRGSGGLSAAAPEMHPLLKKFYSNK